MARSRLQRREWIRLDELMREVRGGNISFKHGRGKVGIHE